MDVHLILVGVLGTPIRLLSRLVSHPKLADNAPQLKVNGARR